MNLALALAVFCALAGCALAQTQPSPADLILRNGKIVTNNRANPEVRAIAVKGDRIVYAGTEEGAKAFTGARTKVIDLAGKLAIPGFIEGHAHFRGLGEFRLGLDLRSARTWDEIVVQVARAAKSAKPGEWIVGRGWHQSKWVSAPSPNVEGFPLHASLSKVSPNNPVFLTHASGHAAFANAKALEAAGITRATPNPSGGEILKDSEGNPTGLLRESAEALVSRAYETWRARLTPAQQRAELRRAYAKAAEECLSKGITSFHDAGSSLAEVDLLREMARGGELGVRLWVMLSASNAELAANLPRYRFIGEGGGFLTVRAIKRYMDGALGSRGAWLLEPYSDKPDSVGLNTQSPAEIAATAELALKNQMQLCVHAIGDRANRETLNIYERAFGKGGRDLRWRIEHAQHLNAADIPRFGALGVIAAMQGIHCTSDASYVIERLGARRAEEGAYVWKKLLNSGAIVVNGTDAPVEDVSPLACYYASVSRKLKDGSRFYPDQRMSREEALLSYTRAGAYAAFEENEKGTLEPGKLADVTVLSRDILTIPEDEIPRTEIAYTIVGGKVAYQRKSR